METTFTTNLKSGTSSFENKQFAEFYTKVRSSTSEKLASKLIAFSYIKSGQRVLDLCGGSGLISSAILARVDLRQLVLVDSSREMIRLAGERLKNDRTKIIQSDVEDQNELERSISPLLASGRFDHVLAIDCWHLIDRREKLARYIFDRCLDEGGRFTVALHQALSMSRMKKWNGVRSRIRERIEKELKTTFPEFTFGERGRGPMVHGHEIQRFSGELTFLGFSLVKEEKDEELADVNYLPGHIPESLEIEVSRIDPEIPLESVRRVITNSITAELGSPDAQPKLGGELAVEEILLFEKRDQK